MFSLHYIPIRAVNWLLPHSAFPNENHMLNKGQSLISPEGHQPQASFSSPSPTLGTGDPQSQESCGRTLA